MSLETQTRTTGEKITVLLRTLIAQEKKKTWVFLFFKLCKMVLNTFKSERSCYNRLLPIYSFKNSPIPLSHYSFNCWIINQLSYLFICFPSLFFMTSIDRFMKAIIGWPVTLLSWSFSNDLMNLIYNWNNASEFVSAQLPTWMNGH